MGFPRPDGNWKGYDLSDLSAKASQFQGKNFFLIHGTADDNVHFQQSMVLTRALVDYNILFRLQVRTENKTCLNMFNLAGFCLLFLISKLSQVLYYLA